MWESYLICQVIPGLKALNATIVAREVAVLEGLGVTYHFEVAEDTTHGTLSGYQPYMEKAAEWLLTEIW